jgi:hypothetical protein
MGTASFGGLSLPRIYLDEGGSTVCRYTYPYELQM